MSYLALCTILAPLSLCFRLISSILLVVLLPGVKLLLFENYGLMQRPQDGILKALERVDWIQYNLPLEVIHFIAVSCSK